MTDDHFIYQLHGVFDNPHQFTHHLSCLPNSPEQIARHVQQCCVHPWDFVLAKSPIPQHRDHERHLHRVPALLKAMMALESKSLDQPRKQQTRLMVSCRSYALLIMSILKTQGIAARCRYGFNALLFNDFCHDQIMVEYWHPRQQHWRRLDPRTSRPQLQSMGITHLSPSNLPSSYLPFASEVWLACRRNRMRWDYFGSGLNKARHGVRVLRDAMIHDLAMVNQIEPLMWEQWGIMHKPVEAADIARYDELAALLSFGDRNDWTLWYEQDDFRYPDALLVEN